MDDELLGRQSAVAEARALYEMVACGTESVEGIRGLIAVPPRIERALRAFARAHPEEAHAVEKSLKFRQAVLEVFDAMVSVGAAPADVSEAKETESNPFKEPAFAQQ